MSIGLVLSLALFATLVGWGFVIFWRGRAIETRSERESFQETGSAQTEPGSSDS